MQQRDREKAMRAFKNESLQYLVSTDVSERGIDVRGLEFIINHQLPEQLEYYTHRSGRTARAGKSGNSIAFFDTRNCDISIKNSVFDDNIMLSNSESKFYLN